MFMLLNYYFRIPENINTMIDYDKLALEESLWSIITNACKDTKTRDDIIAHYVKTTKHSPGQIFDDLNRTRTKHKAPCKASDLPVSKQTLMRSYGDDWVNKLPENFDVRRTRNKTNKSVRDIFYKTSTAEPQALRNRYISWVKDLYIYHKIPLSAFDLTSEERKQIDVFNEYVFDLKIENRSKYHEDFVDDYTRAFSKPLELLSDNLFVYDYLEDFKGKHGALKGYYNAHNKLYLEIEGKLDEENSSIQYSRVIALPHGRHLEKTSTKAEVIKQFLKISSISLLTHIARVLHKDLIHPARKAKSKNDFVIPTGFFLINRCSRTFQFAILDNYISSEMYRYNLYGLCYPDILFVEKVHEKHRHYEITLHEFKSIFKPNKRIGPSSKKPTIAQSVIELKDIEELKLLLEELTKEYPKSKSLSLKLKTFNKVLNNEITDYITIDENVDDD